MISPRVWKTSMRTSRLMAIALIITMFGGLSSSPLSAQDPTLPEEWVDGFQWRSIGPANMSGRITALAIYEKDPCIWWAASASGGLVKTVNNGVTFEHQFDREATVSIGDVQVFQGDPNIVWVGTGEANPRNSVSWGNGVYRSTDGGETWEHLGLDNTYQTGRIALHPTDPNIAYVGSLGRLWGENEDRGLYKTTDAGKTWEKILYVDDKTGVIDVKMHPSNPDTLVVATYERKRDGFDGNDPEKKYGEGSGLYRTTDGGASFTKLTEGLPTVKMGRIGLDWYRADPNFVYALIETEKIAQEPDDVAFMGVQGEDADVGARLTNITDDSPAAAAGLQAGDIVVSVEGDTVQSYDSLVEQINSRSAGDSMKLEISRDREPLEIEVTLGQRQSDERARSRFTGTLGGQAANLQDQQGKNGFEYGGTYRSSDGGVSWERINTLNPRPMYYSQIRVDPSDNNYIYVLGTSLHRSKDGGETFTPDGGSDGIHVDHHSMWIDPNDGRHIILGNDGGIHVTFDRMTHWDHLAHVAIGQFYHVGVDSTRNYRVYGGLQDNGSWGGPSRVANGPGPVNSDWFRVGGGDGFICLVDPEDPDQIYWESQNGSMGRIHLKTGERGFIRPRPPSGTRYRFNWKTPFILSPHNSRIHYSAGNHVFRSIYKGDGIRAISPEITNTDRGAGSAISESPVEEGVLFVGTTDGALWMTSDGGANWVDLFNNPGDVKPPANSRNAAQVGQGRVGSGRGGPGGGQRGSFGGQRGSGGPTRGGRPPADTSAEASDAEAEPSAEQQPQQGRGGSSQQGSRGGGGGSRFVEMLMAQDANEDGKIQKSEVSEQFARFFDRFDANDDDVIDAEEIAAITQRGQRGSGSGGQGDQPQQGRGRGGRGGRPQSDSEETEPAQDEEGGESPAEESSDTEAESGEQETAVEDPISGSYNGQFISDNLPAGRGEFTMVLRMKSDLTVSGSYESQMGGAELSGKYDPEKKEATFTSESDQATLRFTAKVGDGKLTGDIDINDGAFGVDFEATRTGAAPGGEGDDEAEEEEIAGEDIANLVPGPRWVSSLEASRHQAGRCYVTLDGHRSNDDEPYVFATENYGRSWRSIRANLPTGAGSTRVIREDVVNPNLLYLGCEFSAWVSIDRGESWTSLNSNLPTVSVHEIAVHPSAGEIVAGTHGRSLWILDVSILRQLTKDSMSADATLYSPKDAIRWASNPSSAASSTRRFVGSNPGSGLQLAYSLGKEAENVSLAITSIQGEVLREFETENEAGLHVINWDLRRQSPNSGNRGGRFRRGSSVPTGTYLLKLTVDEAEFTQTLTVVADPDFPEAAAFEDEAELMELLLGEEGEEEGDSSDTPRATDR